MVKIRILTTLRNAYYLDGLAQPGDEFMVEEEYGEDLVNKGFAEYVEEGFKYEETNVGSFPKAFLDEKIPEDYPTENIHRALEDEGIYTFRELCTKESLTEIKGIGEAYAQKIKDSLEVALKDWYEKKADKDNS